jgi:serine/threonine protein kinase
MPPEVVSRSPHSPFLADRWSLGILLYTMLNGHCPFKAHNQKELFVKICAGEYEHEPFVSPQAAQFIALFLKREPQERISPRQALSHQWLLQ